MFFSKAAAANESCDRSDPVAIHSFDAAGKLIRGGEHERLGMETVRVRRRAQEKGRSGGSQGKKGADQGIDGIINYIDSPKQDLKRVLIQVKSGHVNAGTIRDLVGTLTNEQAEIGVLITLEPRTKDMLSAAASAGFYNSEFWKKSYPRLQILTIEQLLAGAEVHMPPETGTFIAAQKVRKQAATQAKFDIDP